MAVIIVLIIISVILLLFALLLTSHIRVSVIYEDELRAYLWLFGIFRIKLYPEKKPKKYISSKEMKKMHKKTHKKADKKPVKKDKESEGGVEEKKSITDTVSELYELVSKILARFAYKVKVRVRELNIKIATGDAASTALVYCGVCTTLNLFTDMLMGYDKLDYRVDSMSCDCDFLADKPSVGINIEIKIRVCKIISAAIGIAADLLNRK